MLMTSAAVASGRRGWRDRVVARGLILDAAVVVVLAAATVAYVRRPDTGWMFLAPPTDARDVEKLGGAALVRTELVRWWAATAVGLGLMLVRGRQPLVALAGAVAMSLAHVASNLVPLLPLDLAAAVAINTVAAWPGRRWVSYTALGVTLAAAAVPAMWMDRMPALLWGGGALIPLFIVALAWLFGENSRARREEAVRMARALERERDQQAELATATERARIARELHDAVAHGLAIVVIQAQAAAGALEKRPATARAALAAIETVGRDSLAEMRRLLGRNPGDGAELAPLPGPADLPVLVDRVNRAGLPVRLSVLGDAAALPTGIALSVYRIVQEALTNGLKHAGPGATATVTVHCGPGGVEVSVTDTGTGAGTPIDSGRGGGLRGMRERVELLGGSLDAGNRPDGGFGVHARLPVAGS
jgi:signal transduction histidine kinase